MDQITKMILQHKSTKLSADLKERFILENLRTLHFASLLAVFAVT
jgi:hypothetical protein